MNATLRIQTNGAALWRGPVAVIRETLESTNCRKLSINNGVGKGLEASRTFRAERWVQGQLTRAIGQVLLDAERNAMDKKKLLELLTQTGAAKSYPHFRESIKMLEKMKRIEVSCMGPVKIGSRERKFSVRLTSRGRHVYSWHRLNSTAYSGFKDNAFDTGSRTKTQGLADAL